MHGGDPTTRSSSGGDRDTRAGGDAHACDDTCADRDSCACHTAASVGANGSTRTTACGCCRAADSCADTCC
jgi:hypothetical protein